jgi:hypothetical protein
MCQDTYLLDPITPYEADPTSSQYIVLWLDMHDPFGTGYLPYMTSNTTTINRIADKSSGANHASYVNVSGTVNYIRDVYGLTRGVLNFTGNVGYYQTPSFAVDFSNGLSVFVVYNHLVTSPATTGALIDRGVAGNNTDRFFIRHNSGANTLRFEVSNPSTSVTTGALSQYYTYVINGNFDPSLGSNNVEVRVNNGVAVSATGNTPLGNNSRPFNIGTQLALGTYARGTIKEIIVYNRPVSSTSRTNIYNYLTHKWGIL